jgi:3-deoxy-D-manno-octulosonic acid (KDO) 8-phosphate synthase
MTVIQKARGIDNYFDAVFGFLFRKTDFFTNASKSKEIIEIQFKKYLNKYQDKLEREKKNKREKRKRTSSFK